MGLQTEPSNTGLRTAPPPSVFRVRARNFLVDRHRSSCSAQIMPVLSPWTWEPHHLQITGAKETEDKYHCSSSLYPAGNDSSWTEKKRGGKESGAGISARNCTGVGVCFFHLKNGAIGPLHRLVAKPKGANVIRELFQQ